MAKKVTGYIKLQIPAAKATPAPPVGPALGQHDVHTMLTQCGTNTRSSCWSRTGSAWCEHHGLLQGIQ